MTELTEPKKGTKTCPHCGAVHDTESAYYPVAERYKVHCEWCKLVLKEDRSCWDFSVTLKTPGDPQKKAE